MGIVEDLPYKSARVPFGSSDRLLLFSDGLFEQFDESLEEYGEERLMRKVEALRGENVGLIIEQILDDVYGFLRETPTQDDITVLGLEHKSN